MRRLALILLVAFGLLGVCVPVGAQAPQPRLFDTPDLCINALVSGQFEYYLPTDLRGTGVNPADGKKNILLPLPRDGCVHMKTAGGIMEWVPQKEGTALRWRREQDGVLVPYARDDCGNPVDGVVYPPSKTLITDEIQRSGGKVEPGPQGTPGQRGERGLKGDKGDKGDTGPPGQQSQAPQHVSHKKAWIVVGVLATVAAAIGGHYAYEYYKPCPPGTVRR